MTGLRDHGSDTEWPHKTFIWSLMTGTRALLYYIDNIGMFGRSSDRDSFFFL